MIQPPGFSTALPPPPPSNFNSVQGEMNRWYYRASFPVLPHHSLLNKLNLSTRFYTLLKSYYTVWLTEDQTQILYVDFSKSYWKNPGIFFPPLGNEVRLSLAQRWFHENVYFSATLHKPLEISLCFILFFHVFFKYLYATNAELLMNKLMRLPNAKSRLTKTNAEN